MFNAIAGIFPGMRGFLGLGAKGAVVGGKGGPPTTFPDSVSLMATNGMAFGKNKIVPYAKGGIVSQPTLFKYASGGAGRFGLMGEAGPEAIMPLRRGPNGKLGVESSGAGMGNITVNVDASGSSVEGDSAQASQLGKNDWCCSAARTDQAKASWRPPRKLMATFPSIDPSFEALSAANVRIAPFNTAMVTKLINFMA